MQHDKPLSDIRVLAIESYGAGPWATLQLADLGAEVIKIETPPAGDISRYVPPGAQDGDSLFYQCLNRGKKSITLDLNAPGGREALYRLVSAVDVLFANPKGTMPEKMGITYDSLKRYNPRLVCCFLTGYGRVGPRKGQPGYDYLAQGLSGIAWMGGEPDGPPARCGVSVIDMATGTNAAFLMMAAIHRARITGRGCTVDTSLLETAIAYANYLNTWHLTTGWEPQKLPLGAHQSIVPSQLFRTSDGWLMVMAQQDKFFYALVGAMGIADLADDHPFQDPGGPISKPRRAFGHFDRSVQDPHHLGMDCTAGRKSSSGTDQQHSRSASGPPGGGIGADRRLCASESGSHPPKRTAV